MDLFIDIIIFLNYLVFSYFVMVQSFYSLLMLLSIPQLYIRTKEVKEENFERILVSESVPQISIIVPAFNEAANIVFIVDCLLNLSYRYKEIIIVNDASTDNMMEVLKSTFKLVPVPPNLPPKVKTQKVYNYYRSKEFPNLIIIDKAHGGKVDSDNAGLNAATSDYYVTLDADTIITDTALQQLVRPFMMKGEVIGCGGTIGIANECIMARNKIGKIVYPKNFLAGIQVIEYLRAFIMGKLGWRHLGGHLIVSGAFGLFDKKAVIDNEGYKLEIGDDVELTVRLNRIMKEKKQPYAIEYIPDLVSLTQVPFKLKSLMRQRERWQRGIIEVMWQNKIMIFNPKYGKVGMIGIPYFVFIEGISPFIEVSGYIVAVICIIIGIINWYGAMWLMLLAFGFPIVLTCVCIFLENLSLKRYYALPNIFRMIRAAILEQCGVRQILVFARLYGLLKWVVFKIRKKEQVFTPEPRKSFK